MKSCRKNLNSVLVTCLLLSGAIAARGDTKMPTEPHYTNSIGMKLVRIEPGAFTMGLGAEPLLAHLVTSKSHFATGDFDEHPAHKVEITRPFYMAVYEATNAQYEQFDPDHKRERGRAGVSKEDNEPVVFVSWHDAVAFCKWLGEKEKLGYRLPTEAEWEYACRAGTETPFYTGDTLPEDVSKTGRDDLTVGRTKPNVWGLYDMHGNLEEWCHDWYGPYEPAPQTDPVGRVDSLFKVARGGSHSTDPYYLRSANRAGSVPEDRQWFTGFRVVIGELPNTPPLPTITENHQRYVRQFTPPDLTQGPAPEKPYFKKPQPFVIIPKDAKGPVFGRHNHFPAVVECPNGDLLAAWFSCMEEQGRELAIAASRLRYGRLQWQPASSFWDAPDRNDHTTAFYNDGKGTIYHFNGLGVSHSWKGLAMILRKSKDSGATWSKPRLIFGDHDKSRGTVESVFETADGQMLLPSDGRGGSIIALSGDQGQTWYDPGGNIRGIHAGVVQLKDNRLMAFGRRKPIDGKIPISLSSDMGKSWQYSAGEFQPLHLGQRVAFMKLKQGPLFLASFCKKMMITDASGSKRPISGLFAAVSEDEGKTWPYRRLISDDGRGRNIETMDAHPVTMDANHAEFVGYLTVCQSRDGLVHLLSSQEHYSFNLKWLTSPPPAAAPPAAPTPRKLRVKKDLAITYKPSALPSRDNWGWNFRGAKEDQITIGSDNQRVRITTGENQQCWWRSAEAPAIKTIDQAKGFTAEIAAQITKTTRGHRGLDLELYDGAGSRYAITVTDTGVYWYEGIVYGSVFLEFEQFTPVAQGLDNTDAMHTYRLAVRPDRVVQIYRDQKLLGTTRYEYRTPRDAYILFGAGRGVQATMGYVAYDLDGPYRP
ncbi:MAG: SUMF1/EgtB/PvdO family nonheme iron enzyme [Planctomycetota bacterium]